MTINNMKKKRIGAKIGLLEGYAARQPNGSKAAAFVYALKPN